MVPITRLPRGFVLLWYIFYKCICVNSEVIRWWKNAIISFTFSLLYKKKLLILFFLIYNFCVKERWLQWTPSPYSAPVQVPAGWLGPSVRLWSWCVWFELSLLQLAHLFIVIDHTVYPSQSSCKTWTAVPRERICCGS